jgi:hypothetical protein
MVVGFSPPSLPVPHLHTQRSRCLLVTASCRHPEAHWLCLPGQALKGQFTQLVMDDQHHFEGTTNTDGVTFDGGWVSQPIDAASTRLLCTIIIVCACIVDRR